MLTEPQICKGMRTHYTKPPRPPGLGALLFASQGRAGKPADLRCRSKFHWEGKD